MAKMGSIRLDPGGRIQPEPVDHSDHLPDSILLQIFNKIGDVKALDRCCVVSRRFHALVPQVDNVVVLVDGVISDDDASLATSSGSSDASGKSRHPISYLFRVFLSGLFKPLQALSQLVIPSSRRLHSPSEYFVCGTDKNSVTHHSPNQVLKNFNEIKVLRIELPTGELGIDEGVLLKWKASFGSTLDSSVILGASSVSTNTIGNGVVENDKGSIPESFYMNHRLRLRVVWTTSSLIAASARHYLLQPIIAEHETLESLILTDADKHGVLSMDKEQLEELRTKPLSASSASKRTIIPNLNMRLWYAPQLELPNGMVLKGATLVAIRPSEQPKNEVNEGNWVASASEEPFGTAARMLVKRRTYYLEMNSF